MGTTRVDIRKPQELLENIRKLDHGKAGDVMDTILEEGEDLLPELVAALFVMTTTMAHDLHDLKRKLRLLEWDEDRPPLRAMN